MVVVLGAVAARAQDAPPFLLAEPAEYTDVLDAFDDDDPFDFAVDLKFVRRVQTSTIEREVSGGVEAFAPVAESEETLNSLVLGIEAGLYRDLMLYGRLPLVLSESRQLRMPAAASCSSSACESQRAQIRERLTPAPGEAPLFDLDRARPVESKTRSGVPHVDIGVAWGVTNQFRTRHLPTWVLRFESRFSVGTDRKACLEAGRCDPGLGRGTSRVKLESRWSYRFRYLEPYAGVSYAYEWAQSARERFEPEGESGAYVGATPPSVAETTLGLVIVPWEQRGRFQRFAIDSRFDAAYVSAGRDYTPLFDALGTSSSALLATPGFSGLTQADGHARLRFESALAMQAAQFVRFRLGLAFSTLTAHLLTDAARCSEQGSRSSAGACGRTQPNPTYRAIIDLPGQRFRMRSDLAYELFAMASGQF